jgi:hypothetical protein
METALIEVKRIELHESMSAERISLQRAAVQCQTTIDEFWKKIRKYQPYLGSTARPSKVKEAWMKIRWAICKEEDVEKFKADLRGHTAALGVLIAAVKSSVSLRILVSLLPSSEVGQKNGQIANAVNSDVGG